VDTPDEFAITWALFSELEEAVRDWKLPDPTVDGLMEGAEDTIGTDGLLSGWALVATFLRARQLEHAETVGCDCGTDAWLRWVQFENVSAHE
jgi:hypothetical protein